MAGAARTLSYARTCKTGHQGALLPAVLGSGPQPGEAGLLLGIKNTGAGVPSVLDLWAERVWVQPGVWNLTASQ